MTTLISILLTSALTVLLASAAVGLGAILLGLGRQPMPASGPATMTIGTEAHLFADCRCWASRSPSRSCWRRLSCAPSSSAMRRGRTSTSSASPLRRRSSAPTSSLGVRIPRRLAPFTALLAAGLVVFSLGLDARVDPLVPALQQPMLLTIHVGAAVLAYAVSALLSWRRAEIAQARGEDRIAGFRLQPWRAVGHRAVLIAFPILTIAIALGSVWANLAWRSYWSNDPKELAAAATWLVFGAYLHVAGRRDRWERLAPWLIVLGFAGVLFTYVGAGLFLVGEHSYGQP